MNNKGQVALEVATFILVFIIFAISAVVMANIIKPIDTALQNADIPEEAKTISSIGTSKFLNSTNNLSPMVVVIFWIAGLVSAFLIDSHPAFMVVSIIMLVFITLFAAIMANVYDDATYSLDRSDYTLTTWIAERLVAVSLFMGASIIIVMFAKFRGGGMSV